MPRKEVDLASGAIPPRTGVSDDQMRGEDRVRVTADDRRACYFVIFNDAGSPLQEPDPAFRRGFRQSFPAMCGRACPLQAFTRVVRWTSIG